MKKRTNKTKEQLLAEIKHKENIAHQKRIVRDIFPLLETLDTIYDAQTAVNAAAGFIKYGMEEMARDLKVGDIEINFGDKGDEKVKHVVSKVVGLLEQEKAKDTASLLERVGTALGQYSAAQYLKNPMKKVKVTDLVAD